MEFRPVYDVLIEFDQHEFRGLLPEMEVFPNGVVHGPTDGWKGVSEVGQDRNHGEFLGKNVATGGMEMRYDHSLVEIEAGSATAFRPALEEIGVEARQDEKLVGALHVEKEAFMAAGPVYRIQILVAVVAFDLTFGLLTASVGSAAKLGANDGDVVGNSNFRHTDSFEGVSDDDEKKQFGGEQGGAVPNHEIFEKLGMIQYQGDRFGVLTEVSETLLAPIR